MELNLELVTQLETLTRLGKTQEISQILENLVLSRTPRELAARLAQICFRNSLYLQCLRILNPIVRAPAPLKIPTRPQEIIWYSSALVSLSMYSEARALLTKLDGQAEPEALLMEAFSYFGEWNYQKTIPILKRFITNPRLSSYRQLVGKVNLAAAYVSSQMLDPGEVLLQELIEITSQRNLKLLKGNCLELLAQIRIQQKDYQAALDCLDLAETEFSDPNSIYFFFIRKWRCICQLLLDPSSLAKQAACRDLKNEALRWRHWETGRDVDLYIAYATQDQDLLGKILVGTPSTHFLKKVSSLFGANLIRPPEFCLRSNLADHSKDKTTIRLSELSHRLETNSIPSRLLRIMTRDFYKPTNLGLLFSLLHPDEHFNPLTSEKRVLNQVYALRDRLNQQGSFAILRKNKMDFIFELAPQSELVFDSVGHRSRYIPTLKEKIKTIFGANLFSSQELAAQLRCSQRKVQTLIKTFLADEYLIKVGAGPRSKYALSCFRRNHFQVGVA